MLLHNAQELDDDFGAGADEHLALPSFFGVIDGVERIIKYTCFDHGNSLEILNSVVGGEVSNVTRKFSCQSWSRSRKSALEGFFRPCCKGKDNHKAKNSNE